MADSLLVDLLSVTLSGYHWEINNLIFTYFPNYGAKSMHI